MGVSLDLKDFDAISDKRFPKICQRARVPPATCRAPGQYASDSALPARFKLISCHVPYWHPAPRCHRYDRQTPLEPVQPMVFTDRSQVEQRRQSRADFIDRVAIGDWR
jgi:hypothetical protein